MKRFNSFGFTIVELLVVIVVIGILASITVVAYTGIQKRAQLSKINSDLLELSKAIQSASINKQKTLIDMTASTYTAWGCVAQSPGTDLATLSKSDPCWTQYLSTLDAISTNSGINVRSMVDPWGRPYYIDENEGEGGTGCSQDVLQAYTLPMNSSNAYAGTSITVPLSRFSGCN